MKDISEQSGKQYPSAVFVLSIFSSEIWKYWPSVSDYLMFTMVLIQFSLFIRFYSILNSVKPIMHELNILYSKLMM